MDLITYALSKKGSEGSVTPIIPTIGENGNWYIDGIDTGVRAAAQDNVEVDGILKVNSETKKISVVKDGVETIVSEYTEDIEQNKIVELFE